MKIFILLPDGIGIRNFVYTDFIDKTSAAGHQVTLWAEQELLNLTDNITVTKLALPDLPSSDKHAELLRKAWQTGMLQYESRKFNDNVYLSYISKPDIKRKRELLKIFIVKWILLTNRSYRRLNLLKSRYIKIICKKSYYKKCLEELESQKPALLFCTHQRAINAIAPLEAAKKLGIPTACFIYSWDNLSKATLFVDSDYYLVWSEYMKQELLTYHPEIRSENIFITGTPQFAPYFNDNLKIGHGQFADKFNLPKNRRWICFSGDDTKTSPHDPVYLKQLAEAVRSWNNKEQNQLHILFRRCPVDKSDRFDRVLAENQDIITSADPRWRSSDNDSGWHQIIPRREDVALLVNTVLHCDMVINVGSTMAFDFCIFNKPTLFINYNAVKDNNWHINLIYRFIHFRSMAGTNPVLWVNSESDWLIKIKEAFNNRHVVSECKRWYETITLHPLDKANDRIIASLEEIIRKCTSAS